MPGRSLEVVAISGVGTVSTTLCLLPQALLLALTVAISLHLLLWGCKLQVTSNSAAGTPTGFAGFGGHQGTQPL